MEMQTKGGTVAKVVSLEVQHQYFVDILGRQIRGTRVHPGANVSLAGCIQLVNETRVDSRFGKRYK